MDLRFMSNMKKKVIAVALFAVAIIGYVVFNTQQPRYYEVNIASQAKLSVFQTGSGVGGNPPTSIVDNNKHTWWYGYVDGKHPNWIVLVWEKPVSIDKVVINFGGHRYAIDYKLQIWDGVLWKDIMAVSNNQSDEVTHIFPKGREATISEIRLYVTKTFQPDNLLRVTEFYIHQKHLKSFLPSDILAYLGYAALLLVILFGIFSLLPQLLKRILGVKYGRGIIFIFGIIVVIGIFLIFFNTARQKYIYVNIAPEAAVSAKQTESGFLQKQGGFASCIIDGDETTWWYGHVSAQNPNWVVLRWDKVKEIDRIKIIFSLGRYAIDYKIQVWNGASWEKRTIITNNSSDSKIHSFLNKNRIQTTKIRFYLTKTRQSDNIQRVSEIYVYKKVPASFFTVFLSNVIQPTKDLLSRIGCSFGFLMLLFIPGYVLLTLRPFSFFNSKEKFVLSFGVTILLLFIISFLSLAIKSFVPVYFLAAGVILSIFLFVKKKMYTELKDTEKTIVPILILALFFLTVYPFLIDSTLGYQYTSDYTWQYGVAKIFMYKVSHYATHLDFILNYHQIGLRTILLGIISIPFLHIFGDKFMIYQSLCSVSAILFFTSFFLLVQKLFNKKTAIISAFFMMITPYFVFMTLLSQVRWFICYFLFIYFYYLLHENLNSRIKYLLAGTAAGLAFMAHPISVLFILGGLGYVALKQNQIERKVINLLYITLPLAIFIVPWVIWCNVTGQSGSYYLQFLHTKPNWGAPTSQLLSDFFKTPILEHLRNKLWTLAGLFLFNPRYHSIRLTADYLKRFSQFTLSGAVSMPLLLFALWGSVRWFKKYKLEVFSFILIPLVGNFLFQGMYSPTSLSALVPAVPFIIGIAVYSLWKVKNSILVLGIYFFCLSKHLMVIWIWGYYDLYRKVSEHKSSYDLLGSLLKGNIHNILGFSSLALWYLLGIILFFYYLKESKIDDRENVTYRVSDEQKLAK